MAQKEIQLDRETFSCSICLDLLKDPVAIPCGHSYCMNCIKTHWDEEDVKRVKRIYSCPQCGQIFTPRPVLLKNTMLAALVEELKKIGLRPAPADHCYAGPEDVACDFCTGRKLKAFKSCLVCLASYCDKHLQPHYELYENHKLVDPSKKTQENICSNDEGMRMFSSSAAAGRTERQKQKVQQRIQDREKDVKELQQQVEAINRSADKAVKDSEEIFSQLIRLIQRKSSEVKQQLRSQQETEVSRVEELQEKLEREITELKRIDGYPSLSALSLSTDSSSINIRPLRYFEVVTAAVLKLRDKLQDVLRETRTNISQTAPEVDVLLSESQPKTRADFLKYSRKITLDPNTANRKLLLSEGNIKASSSNRQQDYSIHPDRFDTCCQVLSRESLTGRCYWEVEWRGRGVSVAVAYKDIDRKLGWGDVQFGFNNKSWALQCDNESYTFWHNNFETPVPGPLSSRIGVYLDHSEGILSFYSVSKTMTLLYRVQTTFSQPFHAGFWLHWSRTTAEFIKPK